MGEVQLPLLTKKKHKVFETSQIKIIVWKTSSPLTNKFFALRILQAKEYKGNRWNLINCPNVRRQTTMNT